MKQVAIYLTKKLEGVVTVSCPDNTTTEALQRWADENVLQLEEELVSGFGWDEEDEAKAEVLDDLETTDFELQTRKEV